ncbi:MAG: YcxB family protein [Anaerolineales bacterium]|nr:YcxB family protein [Anaerolineales bacterium]
MKTQVQLELPDCLNAQKLHMRQSIQTQGTIFLFLALFGILGLAAFFVPEMEIYRYFSIFLLVISSAFFFLRYVFLPNRVKKVFAQQKELHAPIEMEITADALLTTNPYGHAERPWSLFIRWKEDDNVLLLYHSNALFTILPKRALNAEQIAAIKMHLESNQVPTQEPRRPGQTCLVIFIVCLTILIFLIGVFQYVLGY